MVKESSSRESGSKKKRKSTTSAETEDVDVYKKAIEFEEKEALNRFSETDAEIYYRTCKEIRQLFKDIVDLKNDSKSDKRGLISEKCMDACVRVAILKKLNRLEKVRTVSAKEALNIEKQKVDSINLQYQNLLYEANHLISEFNKCLQFKSKDEDIELVSIDEFLKDAPAEVAGKFKTYDENDETIKHELRLARLEWELQQRKNLAELCKTLEEEKKKLGADIIERKKKLEGLAPRLASVLEATKPLQEHLGLSIDKVHAEHRLASLLPEPLYLFYRNVDAYKQVYDVDMQISIIGDQDEAIQWNNSQKIMEIPDDDESEGEIEQDIEEVVETKKRRHRKSVKLDPKEEKKKKLLEVHPLSIEVILVNKEELSLKMKFRYFIQLKIVTVLSDVAIPNKITGHAAREVLLGEYLLGELLEGDFGLESPNSTNQYQLQKVGLNSFESLVSELGFVYSWAQRVCGLDFLSKQISSNHSNQISQTNVEVIMKTIRKRLQARFALAKQLQQLERNILPAIPDDIDIPRNFVSCLTKWSCKTYQQFCQSPGTEELIDREFVKPNDIFYFAVISRNNASMEAFIVVKNDFPLQTPIFSLTLNYNGRHHSGNSDQIRDIERELNVGWKHGLSSASWILSAQMSYLCACLDVHLEIENPKVFVQKSMFLKSTSGRNRRRPFKFRKIGAGIFTQY